jgi:hypothetical protein
MRSVAGNPGIAAIGITATFQKSGDPIRVVPRVQDRQCQRAGD